MIYVQIKGGCGNQLFQYAVGYYVSRKNADRLCLDYSSAKASKILKKVGIKKSFAYRDIQLECFSIDPHEISSSVFSYGVNKFVSRLNSERGFASGKILRLIKEVGGACREDSSDLLTIRPGEKDVILSGYWQNMHYIQPIRDELIRQFQLKIPVGDQYNTTKASIDKEVSVGVHVRRGDFVALGWDKGADYYLNAMEHIRQTIPWAKFYFFSDDHDWVDKNLFDSADCQHVRIEEEHADVKEFDLLKSCKHQIVSESSFGWWAAFLNNSIEKKVCIPFDCKGDIWADEWERIEYKV